MNRLSSKRVALVVVPAIVFFALALLVITGTSNAIDNGILHAMVGHRTDSLTRFFKVVTNLGDTLAIAVAIILGLYLAARRKLHEAILLLVGVAGASAIAFILKALFQRERPPVAIHLVTEINFSFPSGHAVASSALAFAVMYIFWKSRWRYPLVIAAFAFMMIIGVSRIYLGVHYPTDILAGWCVSLAWLTLVGIVVSKSRLGASFSVETR